MSCPMSTPDTTIASYYAESHPSTEDFMLALTDLFKQHGKAIVPTHEGSMSFHDHMKVVDLTPEVLAFIERTSVDAYGEDAEFANDEIPADFITALEEGMRESGIVEIEKEMMGVPPVCPECNSSTGMVLHDDGWVCHQTHVRSSEKIEAVTPAYDSNAVRMTHRDRKTFPHRNRDA